MKPTWLKKKISQKGILPMRNRLRQSNLHTVCEEAKCPNLGECFSKKVATVMIMGDICTRSCKFCATKTGKPLPLDPSEPQKVGQWIQSLGLKHVVITSVDRDDLSDLGTNHFAKTIHRTHFYNPNSTIEVLTPDFQGKGELIGQVCKAQPDIFNHNLETVERLTHQIRSTAKYRRSLSVIQHVKTNFPEITTKSGIILGMGESSEEIVQTMQDLYDHGCDMITLGQYLQPTKNHYPVHRYLHPDEFNGYGDRAKEIGFKASFSGPFVRSSYLAETLYSRTVIPVKTGIQMKQ